MHFFDRGAFGLRQRRVMGMDTFFFSLEFSELRRAGADSDYYGVNKVGRGLKTRGHGRALRIRLVQEGGLIIQILFAYVQLVEVEFWRFSRFNSSRASRFRRRVAASCGHASQMQA